MLLRFDPFRDFDRLAEEVGRQRLPGHAQVMAMDAHRAGDMVTVSFDLPGVDRDSIDITVEKHQLVVEATRSFPSTDDLDERGQVLASERAHGTFRRTLQLGDNLDLDGIDADYSDGVLTLSIPVSEAAKPRKIDVGDRQAALTS